MKVALFVYSLVGGGAERVLVEIASGLSSIGYEVIVITVKGKNSDFYTLPKGVHRIVVQHKGYMSGFFRALTSNIGSIIKLRSEIDKIKPDVLVSFMGENNVRALIACIGKETPVVTTEHCVDVSVDRPYLWRILKRLLYNRSSCLVSVSEGVNSCFSWLYKKKRKVIYNPLPRIATQTNDIEEDLPRYIHADRYRLVSMGRLTEQKGFDRLLSAFAQIKEDFPCWDLIILGEGGERVSLERQVKELAIDEQVYLPGIVSNPFPILKECHIFVMSSRYEGFGNVLVEAMSCGLPVISFDCPAGPSEIIDNGVDGILVPKDQINELANSMAELMSDSNKRKCLGENATKKSKDFELKMIVPQWVELIKSVVAKEA